MIDPDLSKQKRGEINPLLPNIYSAPKPAS